MAEPVAGVLQRWGKRPPPSRGGYHQCRWPGCPTRLWSGIDVHEARLHERCPKCFRWFTGLKRHEAQVKRRKIPHGQVFSATLDNDRLDSLPGIAEMFA